MRTSNSISRFLLFGILTVGIIGICVSPASSEKEPVKILDEEKQDSASYPLGKGFFLEAINDEVIVMLYDRETVYMNTGILLPQLPIEIQQKIRNSLFVEDERKLYDFLENYSS